MKSKNSIIIVAGGTGSRMGANIPKQFLMLLDKPIIVWSIRAFLAFDKNIELVIVVAPEEEPRLVEILAKHLPALNYTLAYSGTERFHSVKNGLAKASGELIGIHDAVRPLVSPQCIADCYDAAEKYDAAIPTAPVVDSIRKIKGDNSDAVDRKDYLIVQTPQVFTSKTLKGAYDIPFSSNLTDDASVVELSGKKISLVKGNRQNIKITTPEDMAIAKAIIEGGFI